VEFDAVEAEAHRIGGPLPVRLDDVGDLSLGQRMARRRAGQVETRRPDRRRVGVRLGARLARHADVPQLRHHHAARVVHLADHPGPAG
jgi:hypothetical protein